MPTQRVIETSSAVGLSGLKFLKPRDISIIEEALNGIGDFGEVHLVVERGRLRFVRTLRSEALEATHSQSDDLRERALSANHASLR